MPKSTTFILKSAILMLALVGESFMAASKIFEFVAGQNYFAADWPVLASIGGWLVVLLWTHSLTVGGWGKWEQFVLVPVPIGLGIFLAVSRLDINYALLGSLAALVFLCYSVFKAASMKSALARFHSGIVFGPTSRGILFVFSVLAGGMVLLYTQETGMEVNVGEKFAEIAAENSSMFLPEGLPLSTADIAQVFEVEFNRLTAPYKNYIHPVLAFLVFTVVGFVGGLAGLVFSLTVGAILFVFRKVGFLRVYRATVEKEEIGFESSTE